MTEVQLAKVFAKYDHQSTLDCQQFAELWKDLGYPNEFAEASFAAMNTDKTGRICHQQLLAGLAMLSGRDARATAQMLIQIYDSNGDSVLQQHELQRALEAAHGVVKAAVALCLTPTLGLAGGVSAMVQSECGTALDMPHIDDLMDLVGELPIPPMEGIAKAFNQIDSDRDGRLTVDELAASLRKPHIQKWLLPQKAAKEVTAQFQDEGPCCIQ